MTAASRAASGAASPIGTQVRSGPHLVQCHHRHTKLSHKAASAPPSPPPEPMEEEDDEEAPAPPAPVQFAWEWFGPGELMALQEQMELMPLLALRRTNKAVCADLDAAMPPAVRLVHWILDRFKKLPPPQMRLLGGPAPNPGYGVAWANAHEQMQDEPCMLHAPTRLLVDAFVLLNGMAWTIEWADKDLPLDSRLTRKRVFSARFYNGLALALKNRIGHVIHGDGGKDTLTDYYKGTTAAEHVAIYGPPLPLTEEESIALLDDIFDRAARATGPAEHREVVPGVWWSPFIMAALEAKVGVLRYLGDRTKTLVDYDGTHYGALGCDDHGNNAYAYVLHGIEEDIEWYEDNECDFPDPDFFKEVRPDETYTLYVARRRDEMKTKYAPVLAYLSDELGLNTRSWRNEFDESESEEEGSEEESEM